MEKQTTPRFTFDEQIEGVAKLCVVGVGGGGGNAVDNMVREGLQHVEFVAINTDAQALKKTLVQHRIQAGKLLTKGLGAGMRPNVGQGAIEENAEEVERLLEGFDMCFVTAGMGGGTGTGGAPVVAEIAKKAGALVVAIVTKPFECEGTPRMAMAREGIEELKKHVDTLIVIPNERLLDISEQDTTLIEAFRRADGVLYDATRGIADLITCKGYINLDFADVVKTIEKAGTALMGMGTARGGENRAERATMEAISSPLMDGMSIRGARNILVNVTADKELGMKEATAATRLIQLEAGGDVEVIFGVVIDESLEDEFRVTVIATGFEAADAAGAGAVGETADAVLPGSRSGHAGAAGEHLISYKGEHSLRVLDKPAFQRRQPSQHKASPQPKETEEPTGNLRRVASDRSEDRRLKRPDDSKDFSEDAGPAFLRKMMD